VLVLRFCALKLITSNKCIAQGAPSFKLLHRHKYSKRAIVMARRNNSLGLCLNAQIDQMRLTHMQQHLAYSFYQTPLAITLTSG